MLHLIALNAGDNQNCADALAPVGKIIGVVALNPDNIVFADIGGQLWRYSIKKEPNKAFDKVYTAKGPLLDFHEIYPGLGVAVLLKAAYSYLSNIEFKGVEVNVRQLGPSAICSDFSATVEFTQMSPKKERLLILSRTFTGSERTKIEIYEKHSFKKLCAKWFDGGSGLLAAIADNGIFAIRLDTQGNRIKI